MRRREITYAAIALLTLGFAACSQEEEFAPQGEPQEISIRTRTADSGSETQTFTGNFTLELWNDGVHSTHPMTYTEGTGWSAVKVDKQGTTVKALAHCGNTVNVTDSCDYSISLTEDQSTKEAFLAADVMTATDTVDQNGALTLNFEHRLAKVTFDVVLASEFNQTDEITTFQIMTVDNKTVSAYVDGKTVSAMLPSGTYNAGTFLQVAVANGTLLSVKVPTDGLTLTAGTHYTFTLKVGKNKLTLTPTTTDTNFPGGWNSEEDLQ